MINITQPTQTGDPWYIIISIIGGAVLLRVAFRYLAGIHEGKGTRITGLDRPEEPPFDDESVSEGERRATEEGREQIARGEYVRLEDLSDVKFLGDPERDDEIRHGPRAIRDRGKN